MIPITNFALETLPPAEGDRQARRSRLLFDGQPTPLILDGVVLESQFRSGTRFLLLVTENSPYEEGLHIYLIDRNFKLLDTLEVGHLQTPAILRNVRVAGESRLEFTFFDGDHWALSILEKPVWRLPSLPLAPLYATAYRPSRLALSKSHLHLVGVVDGRRFEA